MIGDFLTGWRDITPQMRQRVRRVLKDWQQHARPFEDTTYWAKRFLPFADVFAHTLPTRPVQLYRAERTDIDNRYTDRFTSWSRNPDAVSQFGWGKRRMVTAVFTPEDILVDFVNLDLDTEGFQEVIVRPGHYNIIPWRLGWDRTGHFNVYEQPDRARAAGITLGAVTAPPTALVIVHLSSIDSYAENIGRAAGTKLARAITDAVHAHHGPVYVIDQGWEGPLVDRVAAAIDDVPVTWIPFDEDVEDWNKFLPRLKRQLARDHVERAVIGGVWYDPTLAEGCATRVYLYLRRVLPTKVDESIVGCFTDEGL